MQCSQFCSIVIFEAQIHLRSLHFGVQSPYETLHKTGGRLRFASTIFSRNEVLVGTENSAFVEIF